MITRRQAVTLGAPPLVVLLPSLAWAAVDRVRLHLVDQGVRLLDRLRL